MEEDEDELAKLVLQAVSHIWEGTVDSFIEKENKDHDRDSEIRSVTNNESVPNHDVIIYSDNAMLCLIMISHLFPKAI